MRDPIQMRVLVVAMLSALSSAAVDASATELCSVRSGTQTVPLVELYTSEGCSSCPPADRWLSQQVRERSDAANWLAFHVDYWDDLGWPDRFASAQYSERQRRRVGTQGDTTVYTPQVMLGADVRMQWHQQARFSRALANARVPADAGLAMSLQRDAEGLTLRLGAARVEGKTPSTAVLWLAESIDGQSTEVHAGENSGVRLSHDRVVRKLWGPWPLDREVLTQRIAIPAASVGSDFTAFVQDGQGRTLQSLRLQSSQCR